MKIPGQYLPVMPYLIVKDAKKFMDFVKEVFNATEQLVAPADDGKIMHGIKNSLCCHYVCRCIR